jgi:hypothetical protein
MNTSPPNHSSLSLASQPYDNANLLYFRSSKSPFSQFLSKCNTSQSNYNIVIKSGDTLKGASVFAFTSSTVTPSATSINVNPSVKSTSKTASSVMILETHFWPVRGNVHSERISWSSFLKREEGRESVRVRIFGLPFLST